MQIRKLLSIYQPIRISQGKPARRCALSTTSLPSRQVRLMRACAISRRTKKVRLDQSDELLRCGEVPREFRDLFLAEREIRLVH